MIDLITGVPGSGKTYYAVSKLYDLITAKDRKYKHIFTNINGLDLDKCNKLANESDYVKSFEFVDLKKQMDLEYLYHKKAKESVVSTSIKMEFVEKTEEEYNQLLDGEKLQYDKQYKLYLENQKNKSLSNEIKQLKENYDDYVKSKGVYSLYSDSLVIVDECHLYFEDRADDVLIRFLSYHRHFNIDLYLITQNKNLINKKYLSFIETMYIAYPASKRFFSKSFRYKIYASYQEYHANIMGTTSLKLEEKIFTLYSSGSNVISKSSLGNMLKPIIILIALAGFGFYYLMQSFTPDGPVNPRPSFSSIDNNSTTNRTPTNQPIINDDEPIVKKNQTSFFAVDCFINTCTFKKVDMTFTKKSMFEIIDKFKCNVVVNNITDVNYYTYILECDSKLKEVLNLFNKKQFGGKHEKANTNTTGINSMFGR